MRAVDFVDFSLLEFDLLEPDLLALARCVTGFVAAAADFFRLVAAVRFAERAVVFLAAVFLAAFFFGACLVAAFLEAALAGRRPDDFAERVAVLFLATFFLLLRFIYVPLHFDQRLNDRPTLLIFAASQRRIELCPQSQYVLKHLSLSRHSLLR